MTTKPVYEKIQRKQFIPPPKRPASMTPEEFKKARITLGLSQQALASLVETGRSTIINIETGKSRATGLWKLALNLLQERENTLKAMGREPSFKGKGLK